MTLLQEYSVTFTSPEDIATFLTLAIAHGGHILPERTRRIYREVTVTVVVSEENLKSLMVCRQDCGQDTDDDHAAHSK